MILWGSNIPQTRTPDAHFMTEARYKGQKVVVVSPDYAGHTKFADHWLPAEAGTDGALAMAMGHVILKEFYVDREVPYFRDYARRYTDMPMLVTLREREDGSVRRRLVPARRRPRRRAARTRSGRPSSTTQRAARRSFRTARSAFAGARRAPGAGTSTSATSTRR